MTGFGWTAGMTAVVLVIVGFATIPPAPSHVVGSLGASDPVRSGPIPASSDPTGSGSAVANFSSALSRLVTLVGISGGGILALVWARVGLSWFSNDITKKVQAKDRARDALVGTLLFTAALSGLVWGLARWVFTGG